MPTLILPCGHSVACDISFLSEGNKNVLLTYSSNGEPGIYRLRYNEYAEEYVDDAMPGNDPTPQVIIEQFNEYLKSGIKNPGMARQFMVTDARSQSYADCNLHFIKTDRGIVTDGNLDVYLLDAQIGTVITQVRLAKDESGCKVNPGFPEIDTKFLQMIASEAGRYRLAV
ncbi:MAG TPA: hypothetical protein VL943_11735 [Niabella sp.]|nr:hypothetical protein [Niabella sp.]